MKKILSVCLALVLLFVCIPIQASADGTPTFAAGNAAAKPGETVEIPVLIENNPGIIALDVSVSFDTNVLTLQNAVNASLFSEGEITLGGSYNTATYKILWENGTGSNSTENGAIATLTFLINEEAEAGETTITVDYVASSVFDVDLEEVAFEKRAGVVTILPLEEGGWSFVEGSTLCIYESEDGDGDIQKYLVGLDWEAPAVEEFIVTTGGWSARVEGSSDFDAESTGAKLVISDETGTVVEEYDVVLFGDVNGDGTLDLTDIEILSKLMGTMIKEPWGDYTYVDDFPQTFAADANHDHDLSLADIACIMRQTAGLEDIAQIPPAE